MTKNFIFLILVIKIEDSSDEETIQTQDCKLDTSDASAQANDPAFYPMITYSDDDQLYEAPLDDESLY